MQDNETNTRRRMEWLAGYLRERADNRPRMEWLLRFVRLDLDRQTPGQLLDLLLQSTSLHNPINPGESGTPRILSGMQDYLSSDGTHAEVKVEGLRQLQAGARAALEALDTKGEWEVPGKWRRWLIQRHEPTGLMVKQYDAEVPAAFFASVADLLVEFWPRVRRCANPSCRAFFLPGDPRQTYCSKLCSERVRQERHQPKRQRDYRAEHRRRFLKKNSGGTKVKVGRKR